jgi:uncharacterized protein YjaZ
MSLITLPGGGPGYGSSLCEALVSEDLQVISCWSFFGGSPEPWEQLPEGEIRFHATHAGQDWDRANYNHDAWFFGRGNLPRWLGYSLGFRLVERFLSEHPRGRASNLTEIQAREFQSTLSLL